MREAGFGELGTRRFLFIARGTGLDQKWGWVISWWCTVFHLILWRTNALGTDMFLPKERMDLGF